MTTQKENLPRLTLLPPSEAGFVLVTGMVILLLLTLLGIWSLNTSTTELLVAGGLQRAESGFNISEGGTALEGAKVGYLQVPYETFPDPSNYNWVRTPTTDALFDPGNDTAATVGGVSAADPTTWPRENLLSNIADNEVDYRYLVTYLHTAPPPAGTGTGTSGYYHTIEAQGVVGGITGSVVEVGGIVQGPPYNNFMSTFTE